MTTSAFTAALTLFLVRALGPDGYGVFALALAVGGLAFLPSDFGITGSAARFIAEHRGDRAGVARVTGTGLKLKIAASGAVSLLLFAAAGPIASAYDEGGLAWPIRGIALALFGQSVLQLVSYSFIAQGRAATNLPLFFSESAVETGASIGFVLLGAGATGAAFGRVVGYAFGAALGLALLVRLLGPSVLALRNFDRATARRIAGYAGALTIVDGAWALFTKIDSILIGAFLGTAAVGLFQAPMRFLTFLNYPGLAIAQGVGPRLARHGEERPNVDGFVAGIRLVLIFHAALLAPLVVWAGPIVELLLGRDYAESADVLRALAPYIYLAGLAPLVSVSVNYLGEARQRVPVAVGAVAVNVAIDVVLIPKIGIVAGAVGTDAGISLYVLGHLWIARRVVKLPVRPVLATALRSVTASAAMMAVLYSFGTSDLALGEWILGAVGGALAFAVVLVGTREVSLLELGTARGVLFREVARRVGSG